MITKMIIDDEYDNDEDGDDDVTVVIMVHDD